MKTFNEIAYNVLNIVRGGRSTNNEHISVEQIKYTILYYRELLIRRDSGGKGFQDLREYEQNIENLSLSVLDPSEGGLINLTERGLLLRTEKRIPRPVRLNRIDGIISVHSPDFRYAYPVVDPSRIRYLPFSKFTSLATRSFYEDGYVWVTGSALTRQIEDVLDSVVDAEITQAAIEAHPLMISIRGVFADPRDAHEVMNDPWDDDVDEFPLSGDMEQRIVQSLLAGEFQIRANDTNTDMLPDPNGK